MTRAASLLLRVVGLALVLVGLMGFVLLGVDGTWAARTEIPAGRTAVLLEPSVVSVLGPGVTVRVEPSNGTSRADRSVPAKLFLGRGRSDDLNAYAQDPKVSRVVGLDRSRELDLRDGPGSIAAAAGTSAPAPSTAPTPSTLSPRSAQWRPPTSVDLWQQQVSGPRARELSWRPTPGAQSVLISTEDGSPLPALELEVYWTDHSWLWIPSVALLVGIALIAGGVVLRGGFPGWAVQLRPVQGALRTRGPHRGHSDDRARAAPRDPQTPVLTSALPPPSSPESAAPPPALPAAVPSPPPSPASPPSPSPAVGGGEASMDVVPNSRRAARGRRRKHTVWDRARWRARSAVPAVRAAAAEERTARSPDQGDRDGAEGDRA
jgi:hypothetical protein